MQSKNGYQLKTIWKEVIKQIQKFMMFSILYQLLENFRKNACFQLSQKIVIYALLKYLWYRYEDVLKSNNLFNFKIRI